MSQDFFSFEKVLKELQMQEDELKRLVSEGEIRAFRDQDKMKFKKEDVERFKRTQGSDEQTLSDDDIPEELVFDEDDADQEVGMATAAITDDSFLEEDDAPLELEEEPEPAGARSRTGRAASGTSRRPRIVVEEPEQTEGPVWMAATVVATVLLLLGLFVGLDAVRGQSTGLTEGLANMVKKNFLD